MLEGGAVVSKHPVFGNVLATKDRQLEEEETDKMKENYLQQLKMFP